MLLLVGPHIAELVIYLLLQIAYGDNDLVFRPVFLPDFLGEGKKMRLVENKPVIAGTIIVADPVLMRNNHLSMKGQAFYAKEIPVKSFGANFEIRIVYIERN